MDITLKLKSEFYKYICRSFIVMLNQANDSADSQFILAVLHYCTSTLRCITFAPVSWKESVTDIDFLQFVQELQSTEANEPAGALLNARHTTESVNRIIAERPCSNDFARGFDCCLRLLSGVADHIGVRDQRKVFLCII